MYQGVIQEVTRSTALPGTAEVGVNGRMGVAQKGLPLKPHRPRAHHCSEQLHVDRLLTTCIYVVANKKKVTGATKVQLIKINDLKPGLGASLEQR